MIMLPGFTTTRARDCLVSRRTGRPTALLFLAMTVGLLTAPGRAQAARLAQAPLPNPQPPTAEQAPLPYPPPPAASYPPQELDRIVSPLALYPDPLLAQVLAATTFAPEIPDAAGW